MRALRTTLLLIGLLAIGFAAGPRVDVEASYSSPDLPADLDTYVRGVEGRFSDIVPGTEKSIVWNDSTKTRTHYSVVYIHGFSGSRRMAAPMPDSIAAHLRANLFMTRLTGHGRTGEALADATVRDWLNDVAEALAIGRRLGERTILIGLSHGGAIAAWAACQEDLSSDLAAVVLLSPNFRPADARAGIALWPWGEQIAEIMVGPERSWEPANELHGRYSTTRYPTRALLPMMGLVDLLGDTDLGRLTTPTLLAYSSLDEVVSVDAIREAFPRIGTSTKMILDVGRVEDPSNHVIAGDILSPANTMPLVRSIAGFVHERAENGRGSIR